MNLFARNARVLPLLALALAACGSSETAGSADAGGPPSCTGAAPTCFGIPDYVLECGDDGLWFARKCDPGKLCWDGSCQALLCVPGTKECKNGGVRTCAADGKDWSASLACAAGTVCSEGECLSPVCEAGIARCANGLPVRCNDAGQWETGAACAAGTTCVGGACLPATCADGAKECGPTTAYVCNANTWTGTACPAGQSCVFGSCVSCVSDSGCQAWESCANGTCVATVPEITTAALTPGTVGAAYSFTLQAKGGKAPYAWALASGTLPTGLSFAGGAISGTPTAAANANLTFKVTDALNASAEKAFVLEVTPQGALTITTRSLPAGEVGTDYSATLQATGGQAPYGWQLLSGSMPKGLQLFSLGKLTGAPEEPGTFNATFRVVDALTPPSYADQPLTFTVKIAPLNIVGDKTYNILVTKMIVLPTLVQLVPYSTQLSAKGGLKPYAWAEQPAPAGISWLVSKWGLPQGLTIKPDGTISGWVTSVSDAVQMKIPFGITVTGYFTFVQVKDAQNPAVTDTGIICLPTIPLTQ